MEAPPNRDLRWQLFDRQSNIAKERGLKSILILDQVLRLMDAGMTKSSAVSVVASREGTGKSTIWGWFKAVEGVSRHDWLAYLTPGFRGGGRSADIDDAILDVIAADYLRPERPAWTECIRRLQEDARERDIALPHARTIWRRFKKKFGSVAIARWRGEKLHPVINARFPANDR